MLSWSTEVPVRFSRFVCAVSIAGGLCLCAWLSHRWDGPVRNSDRSRPISSPRAVASLAFLVWDIIITLGDEVHTIWPCVAHRSCFFAITLDVRLPQKANATRTGQNGSFFSSGISLSPPRCTSPFPLSSVPPYPHTFAACAALSYLWARRSPQHCPTRCAPASRGTSSKKSQPSCSSHLSRSSSWSEVRPPALALLPRP